MLTNFINSFKDILTLFNPEDLKGEQLSKILRWLGIAFIIGFIFPYFDGDIRFQLEPERASVNSGLSEFEIFLIFYLPVFYGFILIILSNFTSIKPIDITLLVLTILSLIILPAELYQTRFGFFEICGINLFGTVWLFILSNCLLFIGISHSQKSLKIISPKYLVIVGGVLFLLNAVIPFHLFIRDFSVTAIHKSILIIAPIDLIGERPVLTGIFLTLYLILMIVLIVKALFFTGAGEVKSNGINMFLFASAWIILIPGLIIAGNLDIWLRPNLFRVYPWGEHQRENFCFIKSLLYIIPLIAVIFISVSRLFTGLISKKEE